MKLLRFLWYRLSGRFGSQTCVSCYRNGSNGAIWFYVPDELWAAVMGDSQAVICLACFDRCAEAAGVPYASSIEVQGARSWMAGHA